MAEKKPRPVAPHIETYVPYLINRTAAALVSYSAKEFEKYGVTVPQWRILFALWHHPDCRFGLLTSYTSLEPPTLSRILNGMAAAHLVKRSPHATDSRSVTLSLTTAGSTLFEKMIPFARDVNRMYTAGLSTEELAVLRRALATVYDNVTSAAKTRSD